LALKWSCVQTCLKGDQRSSHLSSCQQNTCFGQYFSIFPGHRPNLITLI
jgi:hypothetical protein